MQLEDYFEFEKFDTKHGPVERVRIKGHRIAIEHILEPFLQGESPERIHQAYRHGLSLEQVYATITYYLHNQAKVDAYLESGRKIEDAFYEDSLKEEPSEAMKRVRAVAAEQRKAAAGGNPT